MEQLAHSPLVAWESFYVIVGSSGAALTGLQFVVIVLIAESNTRTTNRQIAAFGTPTIVHFCVVLLISAILSAPWKGLTRVSFILVACGVAGLIYGVITTMRALKQTEYKPVFEDWLFHSILPFIAYGVVLVSAITLSSRTETALFGIGSSVLLLLFVGIHNAWDTVTFIASGAFKQVGKGKRGGSGH